jgi:rhodanese-related sulfurtransferase
MSKIIMVLVFFISLVYSDFKSLDDSKVQESIKKGIPIIDIRTVDEWRKTGIIKGSHKITFFNSAGKYNIDEWMKKFSKVVKNKKQKFILICAHGNRSKTVANFLSKNLKYENVNDLTGGIEYGWLAKKRKTVISF